MDTTYASEPSDEVKRITESTTVSLAPTQDSHVLWYPPPPLKATDDYAGTSDLAVGEAVEAWMRLPSRWRGGQPNEQLAPA